MSTRVTDAAVDESWDAFLAGTRVGHHTQSAAWGRLKSLEGWRVRRIIVGQGEIVGGAQVLTRAVRGFGRIGYLSRGPVVPDGDPDVVDAIVESLTSLARAERIRAVLIEPDPEMPVASQRLSPDRFPAAHRRLSRGATVMLDLERSTDDILAGMKSRTRYNVRLSKKRGVEVRLGNTSDLALFHRLLVDTSSRQRFSIQSESAYRRWFEILGPPGYLRLFVAEVGDQPVSAGLLVAFGGTVVYKRGVWSGEHGDCKPNEALQWAAIEWARNEGYAWYDFDGIETGVASMLLRGEDVPSDGSKSVTQFKLGFGGRVVMLPESVMLLPNRLATEVYRVTAPRVGPRKIVKRTLRSLRRVG